VAGQQARELVAGQQEGAVHPWLVAGQQAREQSVPGGSAAGEGAVRPWWLGSTVGLNRKLYITTIL
jgi:hypothetical protein